MNWTSDKLRALIRQRFPSPTYAIFSEVFHSVGGGLRADAIAVAMWRSHGLLIHGFEIKIGRADWLRELKKPEKAEGIFCYCDRWWLVAPEEVVMPGELPPAWGWLVPKGRSLQTKEKAGELVPQPLDRDFLCSILRMAAAATDSQPRLLEEYERGVLAGKARASENNDFDAKEYEKLKKAVEEFNACSGVNLHSYNGPEIGKAVQLVRYGMDSYKQELRRLSERANALAKQIQENLEGL